MAIASVMLTLLSFLQSSTLFADDSQKPDQDLGQLNLEELMNVKISGATREKKTILEAPAIVTVITSEEIRKMGARDLIDVLQLVPGISLALDTQGVVSVAVRGLWAHEGKILLLIDGEEMNELAFNTIQLGHHYPVDSIERLEIIRGPGSAVHGRYAELAVINLITKCTESTNGLVINGAYGRMANALGQSDLGLGFAKKLGDWNFNAYSFIGNAARSDRDYTDNLGASFNLKDQSTLKPTFVNLGLHDKQWDFRFIFDRYHTTDKTAFGSNAPIAVNNNFDSINFGAKYEASLSSTLTLTPEIHLKQNTPWNSTNPESSAIDSLTYDVTAQELRTALTLRSEFTPDLIAYLGIEGILDRAKDARIDKFFTNGTNEIAYYENSIFSEINLNTSIASFTLGGRYQNHNVAGNSFSPRVSAVKQIGAFHTKLLYSWGAREPGIENLTLNPTLKPEKTKVSEIELGYRISQTMFSTINIFKNDLYSPIIYGYSGGVETYTNRNETDTLGLEFNYKIKSSWGFLDFNYSFFRFDDEIPTDYAVTDHPEKFLGMANHKVAGNLNFRVFDDHTFLNLSETIYSSRYGYDYDANSSTGLSVKEFGTAYLTNAYLSREDCFTKGLTLGTGVFNLLNHDFRYIQPYDGGHPPLPGASRNWIVKGSYQVNL